MYTYNRNEKHATANAGRYNMIYKEMHGVIKYAWY